MKFQQTFAAFCNFVTLKAQILFGLIKNVLHSQDILSEKYDSVAFVLDISMWTAIFVEVD